MHDSLSTAIQQTIRHRGAYCEGDIFSLLRHSEYFVRAFEFGLADGAIDCSCEYSFDESFCDRYIDIDNRCYTQDASNLLLFDVKSSVGHKAGDQAYITSLRQRNRVAFYICVSSTDSSFVEVIPNLHQVVDSLAEVGQDRFDEDETTTGDDADIPEPQAEQAATFATRKMVVNSTRASRLPTRAYGGLDQCGAPYRMPLRLLLEAIQRIRACAIHSHTYVNPWTGVAFPHWRPASVVLTGALAPLEHTSQYSAYLAAIDIFRVIKCNPTARLGVDFVVLQPHLADMKFFFAGKQYFVQHKLDTTLRSFGSCLERVPITRGNHRYYFNSSDRFDFLCHQFVFSHSSRNRVEVIFVPEKCIPDEFFLTTEKDVNYELDVFQRYRFVLDADWQWVQQVEQIIMESPQPRKPGERPMHYCLEEGDQTRAHVTATDIPSRSELTGTHAKRLASQHSKRVVKG